MILQRFIPHMHSSRDIFSTDCFKHEELDLQIKKQYSHENIIGISLKHFLGTDIFIIGLQMHYILSFRNMNM
jgi:hypothetical protein